jgi:hypothetical protein
MTTPLHHAERLRDLALRSCTVECDRNFEYMSKPECICGTQDNNARIEAAFEQLRDALPRWIPVTERLPEFGNCVLAAHEHGVAEMWYGANEHNKTAKGRMPKFKYRGSETMWNVTHWMPLPPEPTK